MVVWVGASVERCGDPDGGTVGNVNGQNVAQNVGGSHGPAVGRVEVSPPGGCFLAVWGAGGGYFGRSFVSEPAILHK